MTKKHFIALADTVREHNSRRSPEVHPFSPDQIATLAQFCAQQNPLFKKILWLDYVDGNCGPSGGVIKKRPSTCKTISEQ